MLLCGFSQTEITPIVPTELVGFYRPDSVSKGVLQPLTAQVSVWENKEKCCLVTIDSIGFTLELSNTLRKLVGESLGLPLHSVMLCFSHTHSAPDPDTDRDYFHLVCERITSAALRAAEHMIPVSAGWGNARARIGVNRRPVSGDTDDRVGILKVCDTEGNLQLLLLRVTAHGNVLKRDNVLVSPDYFGAVRDTVGREYHCSVMMIQGAAGNIAPRYFCSDETPVDAQSPACVRSKTALQDMADEIASGIRPVIGGIPLHTSLPVKMYSRFIELSSPVPSLDEALKTEKDARELCGIISPGWMEKVQQLIRRGITAQSEMVEMQYFSVGDWCLCGGPYEFMVGFALRASSLLKDDYFFLNGYTNGCLLYFPTEDEFDFGGYEVYWSTLIYYKYIDRVYPFFRDSASRVIRFAVENKEP